MRKNSIIRPEQLAAEALHEAISPTELKREWLDLLDKAKSELSTYPADELGCIYIDELGDIVFSPRHPLPKNIRPHYGTVGGSVPQLA